MLYSFFASLLGVKDKNNYFQVHILEAIALNRARLLPYAKLSENKSKRISRMLIRNEKLTLWLAMYFDYKAKRFHKQGLPIMKDLFVSMDLVPAFQARVNGEKDQQGEFIQLNTKRIRWEIRNAYEEGGFLFVYEKCRQINETLKYPSYNCMLRHMMESMERISYFASLYINKAKEKQLASPECLFQQLLFTHLIALDKAVKIDEMAYPLQRQGILILCNDLPELAIHEKEAFTLSNFFKGC